VVGANEREGIVLVVDARGVRRLPAGAATPGEPWQRLAPLGGSALAVALVGAGLARGRDALVLAVGEGVARGLPTAARVAVAGVAAGRARYVEGHVGGDLGPRLAVLCDGLVIDGPLAASDAPVVLVLDASGHMRCESVAGLAELAPQARIALCRERFGDGATLACGPAAHRGAVGASLASGDPASFVGRGGLGVRLAGLGLGALHVAVPLPAPRAVATELDAALRASPRLVLRAQAGGFEQAHALAARAEIDAREALAAEALVDLRRTRGAKVGCRGCPTPCGFVFEGLIGGVGGVRGHFAATHALGARLGLERPEETLALLAACDRAGLDAKEVGAVLEVLALAAGAGASSPRGRVDELVAFVERLARGADELAVAAARGAASFAQHLGVVLPPAAALAQGHAPRHDLAILAAVAAAGAGTDPMRSFPFASEIDPVRLARLVPEAPAGVAEPHTPHGKGWLAWWHENLVAAVDTSGTCVFSATALLADGLCDLATLARSVASPAVLALDPDPARAFMAAGAAVVLARAEVDTRLGARREVPAFARALVDLPGMADLYRACRGLDEHGAPRPQALAALGSAALADPCAPLAPGAGAAPTAGGRAAPPPRSPAPQRVTVRAIGPLARALGARGPAPQRVDLVLTADLGPAPTLRALFERLAALHPDAAPLLIGAAPPSAWCLGRRLAPGDVLAPDATVDLVSAIVGG
jgi:aldehyde:ferredoxin oxidoreductase